MFEWVVFFVTPWTIPYFTLAPSFCVDFRSDFQTQMANLANKKRKIRKHNDRQSKMITWWRWWWCWWWWWWCWVTMFELCAAENSNTVKERKKKREKREKSSSGERKKKNLVVRKLGFVSRAQQLLSLAQCNFCYCCKYILWAFVLFRTPNLLIISTATGIEFHTFSVKRQCVCVCVCVRACKRRQNACTDKLSISLSMRIKATRKMWLVSNCSTFEAAFDVLCTRLSFLILRHLNQSHCAVCLPVCIRPLLLYCARGTLEFPLYNCPFMNS